MDAKKRRVLDAISESLQVNGRPPTVSELADKLGYKSPSPVQHHLRKLEADGYITREPGKNRNLRLTRLGEASVAKRAIPILGEIAAGVPILASEDPDRPTLTDELAARGDFALRVKGDSMRDADILDGDYAILRHQNTADSGDIVAIIFDDVDSEATLKVYRPERDCVRFEPANDAYAARVVQKREEVRWRIVGKFVGRVRC